MVKYRQWEQRPTRGCKRQEVGLTGPIKERGGWKNRIRNSTQSLGGGKMKESNGGGEFKYDIFDTL
jgi:hypothetical protein